MVTGNSHWSTPFTADTWFNFAYDIDVSSHLLPDPFISLEFSIRIQFSSGTVGLWASTGSDPLTKVVDNVAASTSTNSEDWHLGVLRIINDATPEDWYFSGV